MFIILMFPLLMLAIIIFFPLYSLWDKALEKYANN